MRSMISRIRNLDWRNGLINITLLIFSVLLVFASFEIALLTGVVDSESEYPHYESCEGKTTWEFNQKYGWTLRPDSVYLRQQNPNQERNLYRINPDGFRDTYNTGEKNVLVMGDSQTAGWIVNDNRTYPHLIDREAPNTSIHNFGVPGYGTEQELVAYSNVSQSYDHELVVVGYYLGNDMVDNVDTNPRRPKFTIENGTLSKVRGPINPNNSEADSKGRSGIDAVEKFLLDNTRTFSYLKPRIRSLLSQTGLESTDPPSGSERARQLRLTQALLDEFGTRAEANDATLLIMIIPERTEITPENPAHYPPESGQSYWDDQRRMIADVEETNPNVHALDLQPSFADNRKNEERIYGKHNAHLEDYGHQLTARNLHRWMVSHDLLKNQPNVSFDSSPIKRDQDCP